MMTDQMQPPAVSHPEGHHIFSMQKLLMPIEFPLSGDALDLCVRKRSRSPPSSPQRCTPEHRGYPDPPQTLVCFSSPSSQAGSENSDTSQGSLDDGKAKLPRPFKAYPKDPLNMAFSHVVSADAMTKDSTDAYVEFRQKMLSRVQHQSAATNAKMRRTTHQNAMMANVDPTYWEKRRKNNEAAKRSRDARRAKEDEIAIRCAFLEQENLKLRFENTAIRHEMDRMRSVLNLPSY